MAELALVRSWSTFRRSTVKTLSGFSRAMEASSSTRLTRRCVTAQCCGARDGADFSGVARARLERHQNPDLSDAHPASGIRARIAGARLSLSTLAVCAGLRLLARQPGSWLRRTEDSARILYALPGSVRHIPFSGSERFPSHRAADWRRECEHDRLPAPARNGCDPARWRLLGTDHRTEYRACDLLSWNYARLYDLQRRSCYRTAG